MSEPTQTQYSVRAVSRALDILFAFSRLGRRLSNAEISAAVGLNPSTVHRLLTCLQGAGLVTQGSEDRRYQLGAAVAELYQAWNQQFDVRDLARPAMRRLWAETEETIGLSIMEGDTRVYVDQIESPLTIRSSFPIGVPQPMHAGAPGKVFLAFSDPALRQRILSKPLPAVAPNTTTGLPELTRQLEQIRQDGYAVTVEEWAAGGAAVAAPIFDARGQVIAVLSISLPAQRLTDERQPRLVASLLAAADDLNRQLRGAPGGGASDDQPAVKLAPVATRTPTQARRHPARAGRA